MKVKDLITALKKQNQEMIVVHKGSGYNRFILKTIEQGKFYIKTNYQGEEKLIRATKNGSDYLVLK